MMSNLLKLSKSPEFLRVFSNYIRMFMTFSMGLIIVRILLDKSQEIFSIYTLITVGMGIGIMLKELLRIAIVPRLSAKFREADDDFIAVFTSCILASLGLAFIGVIITLIFLANINYFAVTDEQLFPATIFILCRAFQIFISLALSPFIVLLPIMRKYVASNIFLTFERASDFFAIIVAIFVINSSNTDILILIGLIGSILLTTLYCLTSIIIFRSNKKFRFKFSRQALQEMWGTGHFVGWTAVLVISVNLFLRFDLIWINITAGVFGTAVFGIVIQSIGMMRQLTYGIIQGLDAAFAFLKFSDDNKDGAFKKLLYVSSYLQGIIGFAAYGVIFFAGHQILQYWLGPQALDTGIVDAAYHLILICSAGILITSFAEVWTNALNGMGHISQYAPWLVPSALANPILLILSTAFVSLMPSYEMAAWLYFILLFISYGIFVPKVMSKVCNMTFMELISPFKIPFIVMLLCALMVMVILNLFTIMHLPKVLLVIFTFGLGFALSLYFLSKKFSI